MKDSIFKGVDKTLCFGKDIKIGEMGFSGSGKTSLALSFMAFYTLPAIVRALAELYTNNVAGATKILTDVVYSNKTQITEVDVKLKDDIQNTNPEDYAKLTEEIAGMSVIKKIKLINDDKNDNIAKVIIRPVCGKAMKNFLIKYNLNSITFVDVCGLNDKPATIRESYRKWYENNNKDLHAVILFNHDSVITKSERTAEIADVLKNIGNNIPLYIINHFDSVGFEKILLDISKKQKNNICDSKTYYSALKKYQELFLADDDKKPTELTSSFKNFLYDLGLITADCKPANELCQVKDFVLPMPVFNKSNNDTSKLKGNIIKDDNYKLSLLPAYKASTEGILDTLLSDIIYFKTKYQSCKEYLSKDNNKIARYMVNKIWEHMKEDLKSNCEKSGLVLYTTYGIKYDYLPENVSNCMELYKNNELTGERHGIRTSGDIDQRKGQAILMAAYNLLENYCKDATYNFTEQEIAEILELIKSLDIEVLNTKVEPEDVLQSIKAAFRFSAYRLRDKLCCRTYKEDQPTDHILLDRDFIGKYRNVSSIKYGCSSKLMIKYVKPFMDNLFYGKLRQIQIANNWSDTETFNFSDDFKDMQDVHTIVVSVCFAAICYILYGGIEDFDTVFE